MSETAYSAAQLNAALATTEQHLYTAAGDNGVDDVFYPLRRQLGIDPARSYTYGDFSAMLNAAADKLAGAHDDYESDDTIWEDTVANLAVNCAGHLLEHPDASLHDVIAAGWADLSDIDWPGEYDGVPDDELPAKGTPERDEAIVATVLSWVG